MELSLELFPPKTEAGIEKLHTNCEQMMMLKPRFFSVTYGAGGSTQERTFTTVQSVQQTFNVETAPHLSCIGSTKESILKILLHYKEQGIKRIVALRGDMPSGMREAGEFRYANELVEFIRAETGDHFHIEIAAYPEFHPQANSAQDDLLNFKRKAEAGANSALTQYFYNADAYLHFVDQCERIGLKLPIIPGIMPITNYTSLIRFSDMCGAEIPRWIRKRLESYGEDMDSLRAFGEDVVSELCSRLLSEGVPGLHFYTMNQAAPTLAICKNLNLTI